MSQSMFQNLKGTFYELGILLVIAFIVFLVAMIIITILSMRDKKLRKLMQERRDSERIFEKKPDLTRVLPELTKDELKDYAVKVKGEVSEAGEQIDTEKIKGLPLKPGVYFDPEKDAAAPDEPVPEPKITHSFLSTEPLPKADVPVEEPAEDSSESAEETESATEPSPWMPVDIQDKKDIPEPSEGEPD